jgi:hypothetical protein
MTTPLIPTANITLLGIDKTDDNGGGRECRTKAAETEELNGQFCFKIFNFSYMLYMLQNIVIVKKINLKILTYSSVTFYVRDAFLNTLHISKQVFS